MDCATILFSQTLQLKVNLPAPTLLVLREFSLATIKLPTELRKLKPPANYSATQTIDCQLCSGHLISTQDFDLLFRVTSDCHPWKKNGQLGQCELCGTIQKPYTAQWVLECQQIYAQYEMFHQASGIEPSLVNSHTGIPISRSEKLVRFLTSSSDLPDRGRLLDIGCGTGAFLKTFAASYPRWTLAGFEKNPRNRKTVEAVSTTTEFYEGELSTAGSHYDVIVMIHVLEHIPYPIEYLRHLRTLLKPRGILCIQVPDVNNSPFEILVADHSCHFSSNTLNNVVTLADFHPIRFSQNILPKELSLPAQLTNHSKPIAQPTQDIQIPPSYLVQKSVGDSHIAWLNQLIDLVKNFGGPIGVFGSSISIAWLSAYLKHKIEFYVDEDPNRRAQIFQGRPIYHPSEVPNPLPIIIPMPLYLAKPIRDRLQNLLPTLVLSNS